jgi:hypothetical protein
LDQPRQLEALGLYSGLSYGSVAGMVGAHALQLKNYQLAGLCFFACLMQKSIRACILASEEGLGSRTLVRLSDLRKEV